MLKQESKKNKDTEKFKEKILAYALKNALEHKGKAQASSVLNALFHEGLEREMIKEVMPLIQETVKEINFLSIEEQKCRFEKLEKQIDHREVRREGELPELDNVKKGKVIMRLAPYPSGPLHIGNTRQYLLNDEYVKKYGGKLYLVIDDTIGSEQKQILPEAYEMIEKGLRWLQIKYSKPVILKSERLEIYYKYAEKIIKKDKAYVCFCSQEELKKNREEKRECSCRKATIQTNLDEWKKMLEGKYKEGEAILRLKTSMTHKNPAFRDRVLFRISEREHPKTKFKYKVWPLLEFSWAIDDHLLEMTHVLRGKELMIETEMEKYIFDIFGWKYPIFIHTGLLQFEGIKLSKSKGQEEVKSGRYIGWDDPRLWSLESLEKRGIEPEAIRKFIISLGINQNEISVPIDVLYAENRKVLRKKAKLVNFNQEENEKRGKIKVIMPDGSFIYGSSDSKELNKLKHGEIFYFKTFGYAKYDKERGFFFFAHR